MRRCGRIIMGVILTVAVLCSRPIYPAGAKIEITVRNFAELKKYLECEGHKVIRVENDITMERMITVRGTKILRGNGNYFTRKKNNQNHLLMIKNATLQLDKVELLGNQNANVKNKAALCVGDGAFVLMKKGIISGHSNQYGGAAVQIQSGGTFEMQGGIIEKNRTIGNANKENVGFGGAICNRGKLVITDGAIRWNKVSQGYKKLGMGGAICNLGQCFLQGGTIEKNSALLGGGIYIGKGANLWIKGGSVCRDEAYSGRDLYSAGAVYGEDNAKIGDFYEMPDKKASQKKEKVKVTKRKEKRKSVEKNQVPEEKGEKEVLPNTWLKHE